MKKTHFYLMISLLLLPFSACDDDSVFVDIDKASLIIDAKGGEEIIRVTASGDWTVSDIPEWIYMNTTSGRQDTEITLALSTYEEQEPREATLLFICGDVTKVCLIKQLGLKDSDTYLKLEQEKIEIGVDQTYFSMELIANKEWKVKEIPYWFSVSPTSGTGSEKISIHVKENIEPESREFYLEFLSENEKTGVTIQQLADIDYLRIPSMGTFNHSGFSMTGSGDYKIEVTELFMNPAISKKVYLGNLISNKATSHSEIPEFTGYTFNPITISTGAAISGDIAKTYIPSLEEQDAFAKSIIARKPTQNRLFIADKGSTQFYSLNQLRAIGLANMGLKLDEILTGEGYENTEMKKNNGVIYSYRRSLFSLDMDLPHRPVKEEIKPEDLAKGVSIVASVDYGRVGLLIIQSDYRAHRINAAVDKVLGDIALTEDDMDVIKLSDFTHIYFDNDNNVQVQKGQQEVIDAYKTKMMDDKDNWYPISFQAFDYTENMMSTFTFSFHVPRP